MESLREPNFADLPIFWKTLIVIGSISVVIFLVLLSLIVSLMFESKLNIKKEKEVDLTDYDDFLNEFTNGKTIDDDYPSLPKIKDFDGNALKNLLNIEIQ
jgi:hypothetical protein